MNLETMENVIDRANKVDKAIANFIKYIVNNDLAEEKDLQEIVKKVLEANRILRSIDYES